MKKNILKFIFLTITFLFCNLIFSQESNTEFINKPFVIYKSEQQVIIAGSLNTFVYSNFLGTELNKEKYPDPHLKPEYLVYELFKNMKNKDIQGIGNLYDTTFNAEHFDENQMAIKLRNYNNIKFISKFRLGDLTIIRYNFITANDELPYFAVIKLIDEKYYLSMDINASDPFNIIGSFSPYNLFEGNEELINVDNMTPFYFIEKNGKVYFATEMPSEDYVALYLDLDFYYKNISSPEIEFIKKIQNVAQSQDSLEFKNLLDPEQFSLLSDNYYSSYYYMEIMKIFKNYSQISPLASLKINDGKIIYLKVSDKDLSNNIYSIILKENEDKIYISLRMSDDDLNNILQNVYIKQAIYNYFKNK